MVVPWWLEIVVAAAVADDGGIATAVGGCVSAACFRR